MGFDFIHTLLDFCPLLFCFPRVFRSPCIKLMNETRKEWKGTHQRSLCAELGNSQEIIFRVKNKHMRNKKRLFLNCCRCSCKEGGEKKYAKRWRKHGRF